jgi:DNA-binding NarL/FixJ family response regulator
MRVMLVSEHALLREGLRDLLRRWSGIEIVGIAPAADDAVLMSRRLKPEVTILVRSDSPKADAGAIAAIRKQARGCKVVSLEAPGRRRVRDDIGADRHLPATVGSVGLVHTMCDVHTDGRLAAANGDFRGAAAEPRPILTRREHDVVQAVCQGLTNKQVGRRLKISEKTVKNHLSSVYRRCRLAGRTELVAWAIRNGLGGPEVESLPGNDSSVPSEDGD